jgi:hypothetical protein
MMRKQILTLLGAGLIGLTHPTTSRATPLDFMFSFTGTVPPGNVAGTVTGEIFGLTEGATSSPTNVIIDSYPAGLEPPSPPQTATTATGGASNTFTVNSMGDITAANYEVFSSDQSFELRLNSGASFNELFNTSTNQDTTNQGGFSGTTYTLVQPTPEPSTVTILGTGLGLAALWQLRQRRRRRWAAA